MPPAIKNPSLRSADHEIHRDQLTIRRFFLYEYFSEPWLESAGPMAEPVGLQEISKFESRQSAQMPQVIHPFCHR
jgi:hypothetical protein